MPDSEMTQDEGVSLCRARRRSCRRILCVRGGWALCLMVPMPVGGDHAREPTGLRGVGSFLGGRWGGVVR